MDAHNIGAFEEAFRIPLVIAGPGIRPGCESPARLSLHDLCPTILKLTGAELIEGSDATSFADLLFENGEDGSFMTGFAENHGSRFGLTQLILWDGRWKIVFNGFDEDELYDLDSDPLEMESLGSQSEYRTRVEQLMTKTWFAIRESGDRTLLETHYAPLRLGGAGARKPLALPLPRGERYESHRGRASRGRERAGAGGRRYRRPDRRGH